MSRRTKNKKRKTKKIFIHERVQKGQIALFFQQVTTFGLANLNGAMT